MLTDEQIVKLLNHNGTRVDALKEAYRMGWEARRSVEAWMRGGLNCPPVDGVWFDEAAPFTEEQWRYLKQRDLSLAPSNEPGKDSATAVDPSAKLGGDITPIVGQDAPTQG